MTIKRLWHTFRLCTILSGTGRAVYLRKNHVFGSIGENVVFMNRKVPLYANLIRIGNDVKIAPHVSFLTHDIIHSMLNFKNSLSGGRRDYLENIGCIEIMDNVFVGENVTILNDVRIGSNSIISAGTVVTIDTPENSVIAGVPAKVICSMDEYPEKRKKRYPSEMAPKHQVVSKELENYMWEVFEKRRKD